eukprot:GHVU01021651.1.p1 GENE.GHVU01021651.1~~GHVU01021651.1.p1  ORF type:complete len:252 (+),score=19.36 GHVU01021651.1:92-847(+)
MEGNNSGLCGASSAAEDCGAKNEGPLSSSCGDGGSGAANATVDTPNIVGSDARESDAPQGRRRDAEDRGPITVKFAVSRPSRPESAREAIVSPADTVGQLKRIHFAEELRSGYNVRIIFQGRILDDGATVRSLSSLADGSVLHAHVASPVRREVGSRLPSPADSAEDLWAFLLYIAMSIIVAVAWKIKKAHPRAFDSFSSLSLYVFTGLVLYVIFTFFVRVLRGLAFRRMTASAVAASTSLGGAEPSPQNG